MKAQPYDGPFAYLVEHRVGRPLDGDEPEVVTDGIRRGLIR